MLLSMGGFDTTANNLIYLISNRLRRKKEKAAFSGQSNLPQTSRDAAHSLGSDSPAANRHAHGPKASG